MARAKGTGGSRTGTVALVETTADNVTCPAGCPIRCGDAVLCAVEKHEISRYEDPQSIVKFCMGDYKQCPSWRAEKERIWARKSELVKG